MAGWTSDELDKIAAADELQLTSGLLHIAIQDQLGSGFGSALKLRW